MSLSHLRKILQWLFFVTDEERSLGQIILWWGKRRIIYNLLVGLAGFISLLLFFYFITKSGELKPGEDAIEPLALLMAPIFINIGYTLGWVVEVILRIFQRNRFQRVSCGLMKAGLLFSLAVVIFPSVYWGLRYMWQTIKTVIS